MYQHQISDHLRHENESSGISGLWSMVFQELEFLEHFLLVVSVVARHGVQDSGIDNDGATD